MTLPVSPNSISANQINSELGRTATAAITFNDLELKTLAKAGNASLANTSGATTDFASLRGAARTKITVAANTLNVNLYSTTVATNYASGKTYLTYTIATNVVVGSSSTATPALSITNFLNSDIVEIVLAANGYVYGAGGAGGKADGGNVGVPDPGSAGGNGGTAILTRYTTFINNSGFIWGGGGGGGGSGGSNSGGKGPVPYGGGGGGGGAGQNPGNGGAGGTNNYSPTYDGSPGSAGSFSAGGAGGAAYGGTPFGGVGGGPGAAGATGDTWSVAGLAGGAGGDYLDGTIYTTFVAAGNTLGGII